MRNDITPDRCTNQILDTYVPSPKGKMGNGKISNPQEIRDTTTAKSLGDKIKNNRAEGVVENTITPYSKTAKTTGRM